MSNKKDENSKDVPELLEVFTTEQRAMVEKFYAQKAKLNVEIHANIEELLLTLVNNEDDREKVRKFVDEDVIKKTNKLEKRRKSFEEIRKKKLYSEYKFTIRRCVQIKMTKIVNENFSDLPDEFVRNLSEADDDSSENSDDEKKEMESQRKKQKLLPGFDEEHIDKSNGNFMPKSHGGKTREQRNRTYVYVFKLFILYVKIKSFICL